MRIGRTANSQEGQRRSKGGWSARPDREECYEYYGRYIDQVPDGDIRTTLATQIEEFATLIRGIPADRESYRYAPGKWSIREVVGHVLDTERVFGLRALHFARRDRTPLPSFEQDDWARESNAGTRPLGDLLDELLTVRQGHVLFFRGLDDDAALRRGIASEREFTVRSVAWIIAGHERHHLRELRQRYAAHYNA
jgi:hypothetical protein